MHRIPFTGRLRAGRARTFGLLAAATLLLAGCADDAPQTTLEPKGPLAEKIDNLWNVTFLIAAVVFVIVEVGVLVVVFKFRRKKDDPADDMPVQLHGNTKAEIGWTVAPAVILAFLGVATVTTILDLAEEPDDALRVRVVGQQWWWSYDYDLDGDGVYADSELYVPGIEHPEEYESDIETAGEFVIPVGRPVYMEITSRDVIHSYWIPALNGKKDAVPGRTHYLTLEAAEPGTYVGQCTEYCGLSHAYMRMIIHAVPADEFDVWIAEQNEPATSPPAGSLAAAGEDVFVQQCAACHLVEGLNDDTYDGAGQVSGAAPNLTHFASRGTYAGAIFDLWFDRDDDEKIELDEIGGDPVVNQLEAWLRNPAEEKPLAPDENRGMPNLNLTEAQIDQLVAYLFSLT